MKHLEKPGSVERVPFSRAEQRQYHQHYKSNLEVKIAGYERPLKRHFAQNQGRYLLIYSISVNWIEKRVVGVVNKTGFSGLAQYSSMSKYWLEFHNDTVIN